ncbi:MAG: PQQ-binding-like beta-propeller repeat protein [Coriobacteriia bacterium]|nr:PQQ-binding-like beta-propeller repeat protein [Coriobacteriia bacterium]
MSAPRGRGSAARIIAALAVLLVLAVGVALLVSRARVVERSRTTGRVAALLPSATAPGIDGDAILDWLAAIASELKASPASDGIKIATFLGDSSRRYYGHGPVPEKLDLIWKFHLGSGTTSGTGSSKGPVKWSGSGWTGQVTIVRDKGRLSLIASSYDHRLRRIDAETGEEIWSYEFPDVIKGTNTVFLNPSPSGEDDRLLVGCGSRRGTPGANVASYRCVTFGSGREVWRLPVPRTKAYSQDADSSGLLIDGSFYQAVESGYIYRLDPTRTQPLGAFRRPVSLASALLYEPSDSAKHGGNLLPEGSPTLVGDRLFISSGAGHVYGLSLPDLKKVWDFKTGSDLDSSAPLTKTGKLLVGVEKQYIAGKGGAMMLDPAKPPAQAVVWYFPTGDRTFADWLGGIIGSCSINDEYDPDGTRPALAAFSAIDGNLYVVSQDQLAPGKVKGFDGKTDYPTPIMVAKKNIGGAISTPIIVDDHIIACGYDAKVHVYRITYDAPNGVKLTARNGKPVSVAVTEVDTFSTGGIESTPVVWDGRVYIGSRDGYLYCLGEK